MIKELIKPISSFAKHIERVFPEFYDANEKSSIPDFIPKEARYAWLKASRTAIKTANDIELFEKTPYQDYYSILAAMIMVIAKRELTPDARSNLDQSIPNRSFYHLFIQDKLDSVPQDHLKKYSQHASLSAMLILSHPKELMSNEDSEFKNQLATEIRLMRKLRNIPSSHFDPSTA